MNTIILYAMAFASLVVVIAGGFFEVALIVYAVLNIWARVSACAKNTAEYLKNKRDFDVYKKDVLHWDEVKRFNASRCIACPYRKKYMAEEADQ